MSFHLSNPPLKLLNFWGPILIVASPLLLGILRIFFADYGFIGEEPHYINIAIHMWESHDWMILRDDAGVYFEKPPLLFWLINIFWRIFGLNDWLLVILPECIYLLNLILLAHLYKNLWPEEKEYR